ncbi:Uncharacterised protein [Streptococcus pneumoniae]|nr:Uncharacterised protein [Streptococcus pneumoniae]
MKEKKKNPLFVGILSIILGLLFPICRPDFGYHRIGLGYFIPKRVTIRL